MKNAAVPTGRPTGSGLEACVANFDGGMAAAVSRVLFSLQEVGHV
jgi:hypothetical protein